MQGSEARLRRTRVLLADDEALFAEALTVMLGRDDRIDVVGHARDGKEAVELAESLQPDVVLMDIAMPVMDGVEATRRIRAANPAVRVLILTGVESALITAAREAGASGFLTKHQTAAQLTEAINEMTALARAFDADQNSPSTA
jgi:DNA-binding NarL/FixJ family response regulator